MKIAIHLVFCALVVLTGSSQTKGLSSPLPAIFTPAAVPSQAGASAPAVLPVDAGDEVPQRVRDPTGWDGTSTEATTDTEAGGIVQSETATDTPYRNKLATSTTSGVTRSECTAVPTVMTVSPGQPITSLSAAPDSLSSPPTLTSSTPLGHDATPNGTTLLAGDPHPTSAPPSAPSPQGTTPQGPEPRSEALTPAPPTQPPTSRRPDTSAPARAPAGPTHQDVPSELNVGDDDFKGPHHPSSPLDPLIAGLLSVLIVTTAIISVILFLKFRQRTDHPEFHRLQDLPMDDLMEDTPLSRYSY